MAPCNDVRIGVLNEVSNEKKIIVNLSNALYLPSRSKNAQKFSKRRIGIRDLTFERQIYFLSLWFLKGVVKNVIFKFQAMLALPPLLINP